jgi:hypothetical protein
MKDFCFVSNESDKQFVNSLLLMMFLLFVCLFVCLFVLFVCLFVCLFVPIMTDVTPISQQKN